MEGFNIRLIACSSLQFVFSVLLNACMYQSFKKAKKPTDWYIGFGVWTGLSSIIQFIVIVFSYKRKYLKPINISLLTFIVCNMFQYGFGLYYSHQNALDEQKGKGCVNLETDMFSYVVFLTTLPVMIISNMLYPFPTEKRDWKTMVQSGFTMLDFLDMGELIFSDFGCFITYGNGWLAVFFIAIGISAILLSTNRGLEQPNENDEMPGFDYAVTVLNMIFNDGLFFVLRVCVMAKQKHVYFGLIFVIKEIGALIFRLILVIAGCRA